MQLCTMLIYLREYLAKSSLPTSLPVALVCSPHKQAYLPRSLDDDL